MVARPRLAYVDNLRVLLITLVILYHLATTYGAPGDVWYYVEEGSIGLVPATLMGLFITITAAFFMGFFFLLAAYVLPGSVDRRGLGPFVVERLKRLGIPLVAYAVVVAPIVEYPRSVHDGFVGTFPEYVVGL